MVSGIEHENWDFLRYHLQHFAPRSHTIKLDIFNETAPAKFTAPHFGLCAPLNYPFWASRKCYGEKGAIVLRKWPLSLRHFTQENAAIQPLFCLVLNIIYTEVHT